jgi:hypothetical protein
MPVCQTLTMPNERSILLGLWRTLCSCYPTRFPVAGALNPLRVARLRVNTVTSPCLVTVFRLEYVELIEGGWRWTLRCSPQQRRHRRAYNPRHDFPASRRGFLGASWGRNVPVKIGSVPISFELWVRFVPGCRRPRLSELCSKR